VVSQITGYNLEMMALQWSWKVVVVVVVGPLVAGPPLAQNHWSGSIYNKMVLIGH
jgi:hypothetical protein